MDCLFVYTTLGPHMRAWINASGKGQNCGVIEIAGSQAIYPWARGPLDRSVYHELLAPASEIGEVSHGQLSVQAGKILDELRPRAVLTCRYDLPIIRFIARRARSIGAASILMSDSWHGVKRRNPAREFFKGLLLRKLYDGALVAGVRSLAYLRELGFSESQIWTGINVVDNEHFRSDTSVRNERITSVLVGLGGEGFFVPCRHAPEKNVIRFIRAFASYRRRGGRWHAVLAGSGPETTLLRKACEELGCSHATEFCGWVDYCDLPAFYRAVGAVVLPSTSEPWGLVVNEAMAAGKPVLVSERCGCVPELVRRGVNGYTFDPRDVEDLTKLLLRMSSGDVDLVAMGKSSCKIIQGYSLDTRAAAILDCVRTLSNPPVKRRVRLVTTPPA